MQARGRTPAPPDRPLQERRQLGEAVQQAWHSAPPEVLASAAGEPRGARRRGGSRGLLPAPSLVVHTLNVCTCALPEARWLQPLALDPPGTQPVVSRSQCLRGARRLNPLSVPGCVARDATVQGPGADPRSGQQQLPTVPGVWVLSLCWEPGAAARGTAGWHCRPPCYLSLLNMRRWGHADSFFPELGYSVLTSWRSCGYRHLTPRRPKTSKRPSWPSKKALGVAVLVVWLSRCQGTLP